MTESVPPQRPEPRDEPMSADKRTIVIAAVAMVALVAVGFVSASFFTTSACAVVEPSLVDGAVAGADAEAVVDEVFDDAESALTAIAALEDAIGPLVAAADVSGATGVTSSPVGPVATGPTTTSMSLENASVVATAELEAPHVVGDGVELFALAIANDLTGQVDAIYPLNMQLDDSRDCFDTASIGLPLAFYLDAGDDQLLLLRVDEDGGEPDLELRDTAEGALWRMELETPVAQPGVLAERLTAGLGDDIAVLAHRTTPDDESAVLTGVDRSDGSSLWTVTRDDLGAVLTDEADRLIVRDVGAEVALVSVHPDSAVGESNAASEPDPDDATLLAVSLDDGAVLFDVPLSEPIVDAVMVGDQARVATLDDDGVSVHAAALARIDTLHSVAEAEQARLLAIDDDTTIVVADTQVLIDADEVAPVDVEVGALDVASDESTVSVLLGDEDASVVVTFTR